METKKKARGKQGKQYPFCLYCGESFMTINSWIKHTKSNHKNPSQFCCRCGKTFESKYKLEMHIKASQPDGEELQHCYYGISSHPPRSTLDLTESTSKPTSEPKYTSPESMVRSSRDEDYKTKNPSNHRKKRKIPSLSMSPKRKPNPHPTIKRPRRPSTRSFHHPVDSESSSSPKVKTSYRVPQPSSRSPRAVYDFQNHLSRKISKVTLMGFNIGTIISGYLEIDWVLPTKPKDGDKYFITDRNPKLEGLASGLYDMFEDDPVFNNLFTLDVRAKVPGRYKTRLGFQSIIHALHKGMYRNVDELVSDVTQTFESYKLYARHVSVETVLSKTEVREEYNRISYMWKSLMHLRMQPAPTKSKVKIAMWNLGQEEGIVHFLEESKYLERRAIPLGGHTEKIIFSDGVRNITTYKSLKDELDNKKEVAFEKFAEIARTIFINSLAVNVLGEYGMIAWRILKCLDGELGRLQIPPINIPDRRYIVRSVYVFVRKYEPDQPKKVKMLERRRRREIGRHPFRRNKRSAVIPAWRFQGEYWTRESTKKPLDISPLVKQRLENWRKIRSDPRHACENFLASRKIKNTQKPLHRQSFLVLVEPEPEENLPLCQTRDSEPQSRESESQSQGKAGPQSRDSESQLSPRERLGPQSRDSKSQSGNLGPQSRDSEPQSRDLEPQSRDSNQRREKSSSSGYRGVRFDKDRKMWVAKIKVRGIDKHLGYFESEKKAAEAYRNAKVSPRNHTKLPKKKPPKASQVKMIGFGTDFIDTDKIIASIPLPGIPDYIEKAIADNQRPVEASSQDEGKVASNKPTSSKNTPDPNPTARLFPTISEMPRDNNPGIQTDGVNPEIQEMEVEDADAFVGIEGETKYLFSSYGYGALSILEGEICPERLEWLRRWNRQSPASYSKFRQHMAVQNNKRRRTREQIISQLRAETSNGVDKLANIQRLILQWRQRRDMQHQLNLAQQSRRTVSGTPANFNADAYKKHRLLNGFMKSINHGLGALEKVRFCFPGEIYACKGPDSLNTCGLAARSYIIFF
ncbi:hypothetical protein AAMO2058_001540000 [Amorphochlora amoebiformis]